MRRPRKPRPVDPDAGEAGKATRLVECEPDVAVLALVKLAEGIEWYDATVFGLQPSSPVLATDVADIRCCTVGLHP